MESTSSKGAHPFFVNDKHVFSLEWVENTQRTRLNLVLAFISATIFIRSASSSSEQPSSAMLVIWISRDRQRVEDGTTCERDASICITDAQAISQWKSYIINARKERIVR